MVFGRHPTGIVQRIERPEYLRIVYLALVRLVARGNRRDLHVSDQRQVRLEAPEQIAAHDLRVIKIELDADIGSARLGDDVGGVLHAVEEVVRPVTIVDRFDQNRDPFFGREIGGTRQVCDISALRPAGRSFTGTKPARQWMALPPAAVM